MLTTHVTRVKANTTLFSDVLTLDKVFISTVALEDAGGFRGNILCVWVCLF